MHTKLEDDWPDILTKARFGQGVEFFALSKTTGVSVERLNRLFRGEYDEAALTAVATALGLVPDRLDRIAREEYHPDPGPIPECFKMFTSSFGGIMDVNCYLVADPRTGQAALFDTGTDPEPVFECVRQNRWTPDTIYLTHSHRDHIACLRRIVNRWKCPVRVHRRASLPETSPVEWGDFFSLGILTITARQTTGHAADGTTFVIDGLDRPVAIVGDAVFAGSMGGGKISYEEALETNRQNILSLPPDTLLCCGHGPLTSVAQEIRNNPFWGTSREA